MSNGITISPKHGVNPSVLVCTLCGKDIAVVLFGKLKGDEQAPRTHCNGSICDDCMNRLEGNKHRVFIDLPNKRWMELPDSCLAPEYLERIGNDRVIPIPSEAFDALDNQLREETNKKLKESES